MLCACVLFLEQRVLNNGIINLGGIIRFCGLND